MFFQLRVVSCELREKNSWPVANGSQLSYLNANKRFTKRMFDSCTSPSFLRARLRFLVFLVKM